MSKILLVEDDAKIRSILKEILLEKNHEVDEAGDGQEGFRKLEQGVYDLCICDIKMPKMDGLEVLDRTREAGIPTNFVVISAHGNIDIAVEAVKKGAFDFLQKPFDLGRLEITLRNALDKTTLIRETKNLRKKISRKFEMIGESEAVRHMLDMIDKVAPTDARVLITGPNGSGKELVAKSIHEKSKITRVGGDKEITVNVRVVAATNKDLKNEIAENRFREDLYHRLSVIVIKVPSLNERKDDIGLLTEKFLEDIAEEHGARKKEISAKALEGLKAHNWTGNIRELRNVIERLVIMSGDEITAQDVEKYL